MPALSQIYGRQYSRGKTQTENSDHNGLPLVCRRDDCLAEVLHSGENGYAYTNGGEFLKGIDALTEDPKWRREAAKRSEEIAASFGKTAFADAIESLYESVIWLFAPPFGAVRFFAPKVYNCPGICYTNEKKAAGRKHYEADPYF